MDFHGNKLTASAHIPIVSYNRTGWAQGTGRAGLLGGIDPSLTGRALAVVRSWGCSGTGLQAAQHSHRWREGWDKPYRPGGALPDQGIRYYDRGTAWLAWILYDRADVEAHAAEMGLTPADAAVDLSGFWERSSGPGRPFAGAPHARLTSRRVLVTQWGGLDI